MNRTAYIETYTISKEKGQAVGIFGNIAEVDITFDNIKVDEFDGIVFIGGSEATRKFAETIIKFF